MRTIFAFFLLSSLFILTQGPSGNDTKGSAIERIKALPVSSLDRSLPKVTLEFFLEYEGEGAPLMWGMNDCGDATGNSEVDHGRNSNLCVEASMDVKERTATVLILVETATKKRLHLPAVYSVRITDTYGATRRIPKLSDLPRELHRPLPKGPKDLPAPIVGL